VATLSSQTARLTRFEHYLPTSFVVLTSFASQAIVLCLDLSESMNQVSAIADSRIPLKEKPFDSEAESLKAVEEIVKDISKDEILAKGTIFT
jgi:hypothetical protein